MEYRREIDGLRAVAVLPVIFFHAGFSFFSGGYVGVDVFFVISGYLITSIIIRECEEGRFSILKFYERRARRILPVLFTVIICCIPFAMAWMIPQQFEDFSKSVISVCLFASNFLFWRESGYFAPNVDEKPLLHTWSLAVEEQYYLFFPLFVLLMWRFGKRPTFYAIIGISLVSLLIADWASTAHPKANFYLPPGRVWELFAGSLCAFHFSTSVNKGNDWVGGFGLLLILIAILWFDSKTPFPSFYALLPVVGTVLIILFADERTYVGRLLGLKPFVGIGLISYSAYLWHQPMFAFARIGSIDAPSPVLMLSLVVSSLLLAVLSWKYVEQPFRTKSFRLAETRSKVFALSAAMSILLVSVGAWGGFTDQFYDLKTLPIQNKLLASALSSPERDTCHASPWHSVPPSKACSFFSKNVTWAVFGDSHGVELAYAVAQKLKDYDIGVKQLTFSGCQPTYGQSIREDPCAEWTRKAIDYLVRHEKIKTVVISYRINSALFGSQTGVYPGIPDENTEQYRKDVWGSYITEMKVLQKAGKRVILVLQAPELPKDIKWMIYNTPLRSHQSVGGVPRSWWKARASYMYGHLDDIPRSVTVIDPSKLFCDHEECFAARNGTSFYFDDDHMSVAGAGTVAGWIIALVSPIASHLSRSN